MESYQKIVYEVSQLYLVTDSGQDQAWICAESNQRNMTSKNLSRYRVKWLKLTQFHNANHNIDDRVHSTLEFFPIFLITFQVLK